MFKNGQTEQWWENLLIGKLPEEDWVRKSKDVTHTGCTMFNEIQPSSFSAYAYDLLLFYPQLENQNKKIYP